MYYGQFTCIEDKLEELKKIDKHDYRKHII